MSEMDLDCDCSGGTGDTDLSHVNPPGQTALFYRIGTHRTFRRRLLAAVPAQPIADSTRPVRPLAELDTRAASDPAIALLDAWAVTLDVLTFYQERIANEGFLRTATERRSVLELARNVGYELAPGVAATVFLAFTVEESTPVARIPRGAQVQSLPGQDEVPQTFETMAEIEARAEHNAIRPRQTMPQELTIEDDSGNGRLLLLAPPGTPGGPRGGRTPRELFFKGTSTNLRAGDVLVFEQPAGEPPLPDAGSAVATAVVRTVEVQSPAGRTRVEIDVDPPRPLGTVEIDPDPSKRPRVTVFALRQRASFFGNNAPPFADSLAPPPPAGFDRDTWLAAWRPFNWDSGLTIWQHGDRATPWPGGVNAVLERAITGVVAGSWVVFKDPRSPTTAAVPFRVEAVTESSVADFTLSTRGTGLRLRDAAGKLLPAVPAEQFGIRTSTAFVQSEALELADLPVTRPLSAGDRTIALDRIVAGLAPGRPLWLRGERAGEPGVTADEIVFLTGTTGDAGVTELLLAEPIRFSYDRSRASLNANVAVATHGETVETEVLGSGDASQPNQQFTLKRPDVTHVSAPTESGAASTVSIRVSGVPWREVPSLHEQDENAQVYALSIDDDRRTTVTFGDGVNGARLPTGTENVVASYRTSVTADGALGAGTLTLLQTRPLGVSRVENPLAATGAEGPDSLEEGRVNAPFAVRTLGRVVTLQDYEDFARAFGGIGKARAAALSSGRARLVHITAVSDRGETISPHSELHRNLQRALAGAADPAQQVQIDGAEVNAFRAAASLVLDPRRLASEVLASARAALLSAFSLARRDLGQSVAPSEVIHVLQGVPGVVAALLRTIARRGEPAPARLESLAARPARLEGRVIRPAELLLIDPNGVELTETSQ